MNAKLILAVLLTVAAIPVSYADHYGRSSESSTFAVGPQVNADSSVTRLGRASTDIGPAANKQQVKSQVADAMSKLGRA
ncbi:MAG TPA: hypothetical protein VFA39_01280 [Steroidobacteraceae bacterium]|nr:hypothetical protein [Steroidobacteraceae bacterium]